MPEFMILDQAVVATRYALDEDLEANPEAGTAIPITRWLDLQANGADVSATGVILYGDSDISALRAHLAAIPFVAVHFPKFTDGRGYSHARRLRALWRYEGTILAFGDVLRDQLHYMDRCGINGFFMRGDQDLRASLGAFELYSAPYQYDPR